LTAKNELVFIDGRNHAVLGNAALDNPRGLVFDRAGRLLALSGRQLLRFPAGISPASHEKNEVVISSGLDDPQQIALDRDGNLLISDWGDSHQVKVFSADGKPLRKIGTAGRPAVGPYDPTHMNRPLGVTVDDRGRIWVAENDKGPKRVSVWSPDGTLVHAFYGPARYGGGGALDPEDKSRFFYADVDDGMEFHLDWEKGTGVPSAICYRRDLDPVPLSGPTVGAPPETPLHFGGRLYLTNAYNCNPTGGAASAELWLLENGVARKVAAAGNAVTWYRRWDWTTSQRMLLPAFLASELAAKIPKDFDPARQNLFFLWSDRNEDQQMQAEEVEFELPEPSTSTLNMAGVTVMNDLTFVIALFRGEAMAFTPTSITKRGTPLYEFASKRVLAKSSPPATDGGGQGLVGSDGWTVLTTAPPPFSSYGFGGARHGQPLWSYPSLWPGLHPSHTAAMPEFPGEVLGSTRLLGNPISPKNSGAGELWAINGNKGNIYVFTTDGLFVATLFRDSRTASWNAPEAIRGMSVNDLSLSEECFFPTWTQTRDGEVFLQVGTNQGDIRIVKVHGLEAIKRLPQTEIEVTPAVLKAAQESAIAAQAARQETITREMTIPLYEKAPTVDGSLADWKGVKWAKIDARKVQLENWSSREVRTQTAMAVADDRLYVVLRTDDPDLLSNSGLSKATLFKTGGGLDLMLGAAGAAPGRTAPVAGDQRLLVSVVSGKPTAMLYRQVVADANASDPMEFTSPVKTVRIAELKEVSEHIDFASATVKDENGKIAEAVFECSVPLSVLRLQPASGLVIKGDIGVLRGDGVRTLQRAYWANKASGLVSDTPSEAELTPQLWGTFQFQ
ncbi:MAG: hypothetical protein WC076_13590, partial [Terrimicrobiaceae bacterium]